MQCRVTARLTDGKQPKERQGWRKTSEFCSPSNSFRIKRCSSKTTSPTGWNIFHQRKEDTETRDLTSVFPRWKMVHGRNGILRWIKRENKGFLKPRQMQAPTFHGPSSPELCWWGPASTTESCGGKYSSFALPSIYISECYANNSIFSWKTATLLTCNY